MKYIFSFSSGLTAGTGRRCRWRWRGRRLRAGGPAALSPGFAHPRSGPGTPVTSQPYPMSHTYIVRTSTLTSIQRHSESAWTGSAYIRLTRDPIQGLRGFQLYTYTSLQYYIVSPSAVTQCYYAYAGKEKEQNNKRNLAQVVHDHVV